MYAQQSAAIGGLPKLILGYKLNDVYQLNFNVESRQHFWEWEAGQTGNGALQYELTDFALLGSRKFLVDKKLTAGYLLRFRDQAVMHRFIQQFLWVQSLGSFRLGHRLAMDESFAVQAEPVVRLRYRLALELPLRGRQLDTQEPYLKLSQEQLHIFQPGSTYVMELRALASFGFLFNDKNKLEAGFDYRIDRFWTEDLRQRLFFQLNWYYSL